MTEPLPWEKGLADAITRLDAERMALAAEQAPALPTPLAGALDRLHETIAGGLAQIDAMTALSDRLAIRVSGGTVAEGDFVGLHCGHPDCVNTSGFHYFDAYYAPLVTEITEKVTEHFKWHWERDHRSSQNTTSPTSQGSSLPQ